MRPIVKVRPVFADVAYVYDPVVRNLVLKVEVVLLDQRYADSFEDGGRSDAGAAVVAENKRRAVRGVSGDNLKSARLPAKNSTGREPPRKIGTRKRPLLGQGPSLEGSVSS
jgi:hypothetical protein